LTTRLILLFSLCFRPITFVIANLPENYEMVWSSIDPAVAVGVVASTAVTDAVYVFFNAAVAARRRVAAASWSSLWYLLSAFAVISYTTNAAYVLFAALGAWIGGFFAVTALQYTASSSNNQE
jgi:hypothetical protein